MYKSLLAHLILFFSFSVTLTAGQARPAILHAEVTEEFVNKLLEKNWSDTQKVSQYQMGAWVSGTATTEAHAKIIFKDNTQLAHLAFLISGNTLMRAAARQAPITVYSSTHTHFDSEKEIKFASKDPTLLPARTSALSKSIIHSISANVRPIFQRLVTRIAWRKALKMLPQAESLASNELASRVNKQLDELVENELKKITNGPASFLSEMIRGYVRSPSLKFATHDHKLKVDAYYPPYTKLLEQGQRHEASLSFTNTFLNEFLSSTKGQTLDLGIEEAKITLSTSKGPDIQFQKNALQLEFVSQSLEVNGIIYPPRVVRMHYRFGKDGSLWFIERVGKTLVMPLNAISEVGITEEDKKIAAIYRSILDSVLPDYLPFGNFEIKNANGKYTTISLVELLIEENKMSLGFVN